MGENSQKYMNKSISIKFVCPFDGMMQNYQIWSTILLSRSEDFSVKVNSRDKKGLSNEKTYICLTSLIWWSFDWSVFYCISTLGGYSKTNHVFIYMICKQTVCR